MNNETISQLKGLIDEVIYAPTKKDAQHQLRRLEFMASGLRGRIDPYLSGKLSEVIAYAKEASGRVNNKSHWISCVDQCWYVFESGVQRLEQ